MKSSAILFPGQGAQVVGMGAPFAGAYPEAKAIFERADEVLGYGLSKICFEGPADRLEATDNCQPGILVTSLAIVEVLKKNQGLKVESFSAAAGLSLGEYTALCFAGALEFDDAVRLVRLRGQWMQEASEATPSGMLTLIGADREKAQSIVDKASPSGVIVAANFLAPGQIVLSGDLQGIDAAESVAKECGVRRTVKLKVAGAFHSPVMAPAADRLASELDRVNWKSPKIPVVCNVTGEETQDPDTIRELLKKQVTSSVMWDESMRRIETMGIQVFVEPGPGKVLCGLARKVVSGATTMSVDQTDDVGGFADSFESTINDADSSESAGA